MWYEWSAGGTNLNSINPAGPANYSNIAQYWNGDFSFNDSAKFVGANLRDMIFTGGTVDLGQAGAAGTARTVTIMANTFTVGGVSPSARTGPPPA